MMFKSVSISKFTMTNWTKKTLEKEMNGLIFEIRISQTSSSNELIDPVSPSLRLKLIEPG